MRSIYVALTLTATTLAGCGSTPAAVPQSPSISVTISKPPASNHPGPLPHEVPSPGELAFRLVGASSEIACGTQLDGGAKPTAAECAAYDAFTCPGDARAFGNEQLLACDSSGKKFLLGPPFARRNDIAGAVVTTDQLGRASVSVGFTSAGQTRFSEMSGRLAGTQRQLALVSDGVVVSSMTVTGRTNGPIEITGLPSRTEAQQLATAINGTD